MSGPKEQQRTLLLHVARRAMIERGLDPDFPAAALAEVKDLAGPASLGDVGVRDLRALPWCSIDNDDSRDLDQLTAAEPLAGDGTKIFVAVADVSAAVAPGSALDGHAGTNTTSVYTPPQIFPMLPDRLSTDLTSLVQAEDRLAMVVEMVVDPAGGIAAGTVYQATVRNQAKLTYKSVGPWLEDLGAMPAALAGVPGLASPKGTWVRIFDPPVEGRVEQGQAGLDVGDRVRVRLIRTDVERGFIDFVRVGSGDHPGRRR